MTEIVISVLIGYLLGGLNPAALIAAVKKINLREHGTKNLGATNVTLTVGKRYGIAVMIFDITKAFASVKLAKLIFPSAAVAGLLAGCGAVVGHIYPVYLRFKGGKGLAAFGGMILALDPVLFLILLTIGLVMILITDYSVSMAFSAASLAPFLTGLRFHSIAVFLIVLIASGLIIYKHWENIGKIRAGTEMKTRDFLRGSKKGGQAF